MTARDAEITRTLCVVREVAIESQRFWRVTALNSSGDRSLEVCEKSLLCAGHYIEAIHRLDHQTTTSVYIKAEQPFALFHAGKHLLAALALERWGGFDCARKALNEIIGKESNGMGSSWGQNG